jgi:hypothetical protein
VIPVAVSKKAPVERVTIKLFKDNGKYSAPLFVGLNDYTAVIERGVNVSVPVPVAKMIEESMEQEAKAMVYIEKIKGTGAPD